jgi:hypothetical protein
MQIQLVAVDAARVTRTRPGNLDGEDLALRCQAGIYNSVGPAEFAAAFSLCDRALNIDNGNVLALSILAMMHIIPVVEARSTDPQADIRQADELVSRALALDPNFYAAHFAKAYVLMGQNRTQEVRFGNFGSSVGGSMGKSREPQIILKRDRRNVILELGLGKNSKQNQEAGTRTEPFSKALFLKLQYALAAGC